MSLLHEVSIQDSIEVSDLITRTPNRIDVLIQDVIAISDLVVLPRMTFIGSIEPGHVRALDSVVIKGGGFATSIVGNRVTFNGFLATVTAAAEDELTVTVPALVAFTENGYAQVDIESPPGNATKGRAKVWVKFSTIEEEGDEVLPLQFAQLDEVIAVDRPRLAEAEDFNRLQTIVEHTQTGGAEALAGGFKARDTVGIVGLTRRNEPNADSLGGESLVVDPSEPGLIALGWQLDDTLAFGVLFLGFQSGAFLMHANGTPDAVPNVETEQIAMLDGVVDLVWFLVKTSGADTITLVELLVEGIVVDSDTGSTGNDQVRTWRPSEPVSKGDLIEVRVTKLGVTGAMNVGGGVRVRYR